MLNGSKTFITNGRIADTAVIMAVTDRSKGKKGISAFIVERGTKGFRPGKKEDKLGVRSSDTSELVLEDCRIPAANLLGKEGNGFVDTLRILDRGRIGIAAWSVGIAPGQPRGVHEVRGRPQAVRPRHRRVPGHPVQDRGHGHAGGRGAPPHLARGFACAIRARSTPCSRPWPSSSPPRCAVQVALEAVQIHGGYGFIKEYPVERFLRDSKLGTIGEGTSEVQRLVIARELLLLRGVVR